MITRSWFVHLVESGIEIIAKFSGYLNGRGHHAAFVLGTFPDEAQKSPQMRASKTNFSEVR